MFTVETGEGLEDANAFIEVAFADTYHADRGRASWAALTEPVKQACIIRATDYICKRFGHLFRGRKRLRTQGTEFPRLDLYDRRGDLICRSNELPRSLKQATAEYALRAALVGELAPDPVPMVPRQDLSPAEPEVPDEFIGGQVRRVSEKVGPIEESKTYQTPDQMAQGAKGKTPISGLVTDSLIPEYPAADLLMQELLRLGDRTLRRG